MTEAAAGLRLDTFLAQALPELSRAQLQRLIRAGGVTGAGVVKPSDRVRAGWELTVEWTPTPVTVTAEPVDFGVVHADSDLVVVDKPAGLVVHPAPGHRTGTLVHGLLDRFGTLAGLGAPLRPGIVHRLDKDTSGLLVVARTDCAYRSLVNQISAREAKREYRALVCGHMPAPEGTIEAAIGRSRRDRTRMRVARDGKEARTTYRVAEQVGPCDLVDLVLGSGRTHQIRVHLAHVGRPVLGDPTYGGRGGWARTLRREERAQVERALRGLNRQALHAWRLGFVHPESGQWLQFNSPLPEDFLQTLEVLRT